MAIPSNPHRSRIYSEFGSSTRSSFSNRSLKQMYNHVFGNNNYSRDAFGGYGKLTNISISTNSATASGNSVINVTLSANTHGLDMYYDITYNSQDSSDSGSYSGSGGGSFGVTIQNVNEGETYDIVIKCWNFFESHPSDQNTFNRTQYVDPEEVDEITNFQYVSSAGSNRYNMKWDFPNSGESFVAGYKYGNQSSWNNSNIDNLSYSSGTYTGRLSALNVGTSPLQFRIRLSSNSDWVYSAPIFI